MKRYFVAEPDFSGNEKKYLMDCIDTGWISWRGKYVGMFEKAFAEKMGVKHAITTFNGTVSLHLILAAIGIGKGDEVLVPDFTYIASANACAYVGATPVFVDVDKDSFNVSLADAQRKVTKRTRAIMPVHVYGNPCDMDSIMAFAKKNGLLVVEDAAEAHGSAWKGRMVGSFGIANSFSFFANKTMTTGEGGMVTTDDDALAGKMRILKNQGNDPSRRYYHCMLGYNYRMTNMQAAVGLAQLERLDALVRRKRELKRWYEKHLASLVKQGTVSFQQETRGGMAAWWMTGVVLKERIAAQGLVDALAKDGIEARPFFPPMDTMPFYKKGKFPVADMLGRCGILLPSSTKLMEKDVIKITDAIRASIKK